MWDLIELLSYFGEGIFWLLRALLHGIWSGLEKLGQLGAAVWRSAARRLQRAAARPRLPEARIHKWQGGEPRALAQLAPVALVHEPRAEQQQEQERQRQRREVQEQERQRRG